MTIYTRGGDKGKTSLANGKRVAKSNCLVAIFGDLDELNSLLGVCLNLVKTKHSKGVIARLQNYIFSLGSQVARARPGSFQEITAKEVRELELEIDSVEAQLGKINKFILPGGAPSAAFLHLARSVCRRAERSLIESVKNPKKNGQYLIPFVNRMSDLLFVLARFENKNLFSKEIYWNDGKKMENH